MADYLGKAESHTVCARI